MNLPRQVGVRWCRPWEWKAGDGDPWTGWTSSTAAAVEGAEPSWDCPVRSTATTASTTKASPTPTGSTLRRCRRKSRRRAISPSEPRRNHPLNHKFKKKKKKKKKKKFIHQSNPARGTLPGPATHYKRTARDKIVGPRAVLNKKKWFIVNKTKFIHQSSPARGPPPGPQHVTNVRPAIRLLARGPYLTEKKKKDLLLLLGIFSSEINGNGIGNGFSYLELNRRPLRGWIASPRSR